MQHVSTFVEDSLNYPESTYEAFGTDEETLFEEANLRAEPLCFSKLNPLLTLALLKLLFGRKFRTLLMICEFM